MSDVPVFVIHGIANREPDAFAERVAHLATGTGRSDVHPIFWGHLGADHRHVPLVVPAVARSAGQPVRSPGLDSPGSDGELDLLAVALAGGPGGDALERILEGVATTTDDPAADTEALRDEDVHAALVDAVREAWLDEPPHWLWSIDNPELLRELGASIGRTAAALLSEEDEAPVRTPDQIRKVVNVVLQHTDRAAAATMSTAAARFVSWVRTSGAEGVATNAGDTLGYQRHRAEILSHVRARIAEVAGADAGTDAAHPVHLVGHSLGAVIALDLATAREEPVHAASVVTFGSHWSLLHLWHPETVVPRFEGKAVALPPTVGRWTNLWERLDLFAFLAAPVFTLASGRPVRDVELRQSTTLFSHSTYWDSPLLLTELARAWNGDD
jgi:hypothetical protein